MGSTKKLATYTIMGAIGFAIVLSKFKEQKQPSSLDISESTRHNPQIYAELEEEEDEEIRKAKEANLTAMQAREEAALEIIREMDNKKLIEEEIVDALFNSGLQLISNELIETGYHNIDKYIFEEETEEGFVVWTHCRELDQKGEYVTSTLEKSDPQPKSINSEEEEEK